MSLSRPLHRLARVVYGRKKLRRALGAGLTLFVLFAWLATSFPIFNPPTALAATTTLTILSGQAEVLRAGATDWEPGVDGSTLKAGDRVRSLADSHVLITFFEGSTSELDPNSDLTIATLETVGNGPATAIRLQQWMGNTWNRVVQLVDPASRYEIETPSAVATVRGTLLNVGVADDGATNVQTFQGEVRVQAQQAEVTVEAGRETQIPAGLPPEPPTILRSSPTHLKLSLHSPVWMRVVDPLGRSAGVAPPGLEVNQIPGAKTTAPGVEPQVIEIDQAMEGEYSIVLYPKGVGGNFELTANGSSSGAPVFERSARDRLGANEQLISKLVVKVENDAISGGDLGQPARPVGAVPGKVVLANTEAQRVIAAATATAQRATETARPPATRESGGGRVAPAKSQVPGAAQPSYNPLPFEGGSSRTASLQPAVVGAARSDAPLLPVWTTADRGGFRASTEPTPQSPGAPRLLNTGPALPKPQVPGAGAASTTPVRPLTGSTPNSALSRLAPQFDQEPAAFGAPPVVVIGPTPTPASTPSTGSIPGATPTPTPAGAFSTPTAVSSPAGAPVASPTAQPPASPTAGATPPPPLQPIGTPRPTEAPLTPQPTETPLPTPQPTETPPATPQPTETLPPTPQPTETPPATPTSPPSPIPTLAPTATPAPIPTATPLPTAAPTATPPSSLILTSDRVGQPIVTGQNMRPGDSVAGLVTLGNAGTLPFVYSLQVQGGSGPLWDDAVQGLQLQVLRLSDNLVLYRGPLAVKTGPLGRLLPGEKVILSLQVSLPATAGDAIQGSSVTVDFVWTAVEPP